MKKGKGKNSGLLPNSLKIISSCLKTVSTNASTVVRSAGASVAASISSSSDYHKDQVTWAGFDKLELGPASFKHVLLIGYQNGFQVFDVEDASNFSELVSKRDGPVAFLQMLPTPAKSDGDEGFRSSHPLLLVVAGDEASGISLGQNFSHLGGMGRDGNVEAQSGNSLNSPTAVQFYSLSSNCFVQNLRFRSAVCMVRCSPRIVAVGLETQIYCIDALTLKKKFSVLTYPIPQFGQGAVGVNIGYGPMAVGPRWLAYASDNPLVSKTGRISPKNLTPPGVSPSTSPGSGNLMARYAMESGKHFAAGIINLGDRGYRKMSRYCPEFLPDGPSSPVSSGSGWKVGRLSASEAENAGMVVVKDYVSQAVISQFRAHTSPISALCFNPSGTLLVTASVHGNNINVFRIMPSCTYSGSRNETYDWSSSHVHLYKLYRGITTAIIQDICFSHYSQWIAIVSSKCTCHIFVISPFGGDGGLQTPNSHGEEPSLYPLLSLPWWSTSSFIVNQQSFPPPPPPPPLTLSVVSRIKNSNSGLLNSVSNAAASAAGKVSMPSGAVAAVFHNSKSRSSQDVHSRNSLEHLLVYTPSGQVIQYELLPSIGVEPNDGGIMTQSGSYVHTQDDELRVKVEPVQWWDVCRRSDRPEREECISASGAISDRQEAMGIIEDNYRTNFLEVNDRVGGKKSVKGDAEKPHDRSHLYLSNAEVQINYGKLPIWQKSKICFYMMSPPRVKGCVDGEFEIEKLPFHEVEIKQKDLLPVFDHFHSIKSSWNDRGLSGERYSNASSLEPHQTRDKVTEETVICHSKPASLSSNESSDGGSSRRIENLLDFDQMNTEKPITPNSHSLYELYQERSGSTSVGPSLLNQKSSTATVSFRSQHLKNTDSLVDDSIINELSSVESILPSARRTEGAWTSSTGRVRENLMLTADHFDSAMNITAEGPTPPRMQNLVHFEQFFQEGYCKKLELDGCRPLTEVVTDDVEKEKPKDDAENDDMLGGMFSFSEEG